MKVGLVGPLREASVGQSGGRTAALAQALVASGADVTVYTVGPHASEDATPDVRVVSMPAPGTSPGDSGEAALAPVMGEFTRFLVSGLSADRPDVVHAESWLYGVAAQLAADRHGIASVQSLPELSHVVQRRQGRSVGPTSRARFERLLVRSATRVTAPCAEDVLELTKLGCRRARISVLPEAVDIESFSSVGPADDGKTAPRLVMTARELLPHKGIENVVSALSRLPDAELIVVGGPPPDRLAHDPDVRRIRDAASRRGVADRVHLTGRVAADELPRMLRSADVFVSASWYEPFGLPVVEAMACGVPVVATAVGGMLDTVIGDVTGILVPPRDPAKLAEALGDVLRGGALRRGMGLAGRTRARARYGWDRIAAETLSVYERAVHDAGMHRATATQPIGA